jgi:anti-sigma regulatory factor (Ser/Thr protein kinase)
MASARSAICLIQRGSFRYQTMQQCEELAALLANSCPDPQRTSVGLFELMLNALEHGNLGISYEEKTALIEARAWSDEMHRRQMLEENLAKNVTITLSQTRDKIRFKIQDMGAGFRHQDFQEMNPDRIFDNHGRGILLARWESFDKVEYQGNGNRVVMEVRRRPPQPRTGR